MSNVGLDCLAPKYLSSKESNAVSAAACAACAAFLYVFAFVSDVDAAEADAAAALCEDAAAVALLPAAVAELAAAVADDAALFADVVAAAASTIRSQLAELVLVVKGCDPEDVCAVLQKKILFVEVSLTRSLTA